MKDKRKTGAQDMVRAPRIKGALEAALPAFGRRIIALITLPGTRLGRGCSRACAR